MTTLANRLLLSRRELDVTQEDLAARAGNVSPAYVSSLERGKVTNPTVEVIEALAQVLGVDPAYLAGWSDDALGEDKPGNVAAGRVVVQVDDATAAKAVQELLDLFTELGHEDQRILVDLAQRLRRAGDVRIIGDT